MTTPVNATALILAAGEGTRMKSSLPKVAHRILGIPIVTHVIDAARGGGVQNIVVVTGHGADQVEALLADAGVSFARQPQQLGTGHAVQCALDATGAIEGPVVVLAGDVPLIRPETIARLVETQTTTGAACVLLTAIFPDPTGYGRIIRDQSGAVTAIIEHKDLPAELLAVSEGNAGMYCFDGRALSRHLHRLEATNAQAEYYLTDLIALFVSEGLSVEAVITDDVDESHGVNSRAQLAHASKLLQRRINGQHMYAGVTMTDPDLVWIAPGVSIGRDTIIEPMTHLMGATQVGEQCVLGPDTRITDSTVGSGCVVDSSLVVRSKIADGASIGPRAHLRESIVGIGDLDADANPNSRAGAIPCSHEGSGQNP